MKPKLNLLGQVTGWFITNEEKNTLLKLARSCKGSKVKFDALAIFREAGLLNDDGKESN